MTQDGSHVNLQGGFEAYLAAADETTADLLAENGPLIKVLREYDRFFLEEIWRDHQPAPIPLVLCANAYHLLLASVRIALSGHCAAVFPMLRTALESAAYGGLMIRNPELVDVWMRRERDDDARKACRKAFTFEKAIAPLKDIEPEIHQIAAEGYNAAIDYGAHPNVTGVVGHVTFEQRRDGARMLNHHSLYGPTHTETIRALCACLDFGVTIICLIVCAAPNLSEAMKGNVAALNELKNEATEPYSPIPG